jgi:PAS domain S-box-containing protein
MVIRAKRAISMNDDERAFFDECPIPLIEIDVSEVVAHLGRLPAATPGALREHLAAHPREIVTCAELARIIRANRAALDLYRAPDAFRLSAALPALLTDEALAAFRESVLAISEGKRSWEMEATTRSLGGNPVTVLIKWAVLPVPDGSRTRYLLSLVDQTDRRRNEEVLRQGERHWRGLIEKSSAWVWETDATLRHVYTNAFVRNCLGYTPEEFLHEDTLGLVHPDDRVRVDELVRNVIARKGGWTGVVLRWRHKDGSWRVIESNGSGSFDETGLFLGLQGVDRDVTERVREQQRLRESEERFRTMAETMSDWLWEVDHKGRYVYSSPKVADLLGYEPEEVLGKTPFDFMPPEEGERLSKQFVALARTRSPIVGLENVNVRKDGRRVLLETSAVPVTDAAGCLRGYRGIDRDITNRQLLAEERLKMQRLEAIGTLAGGIAHDYNNLLHGISGYISMAKISLDDKARALSMLEQAEKALAQSVSLTSRLLTFSKGGKPAMTPMALGPVIEAAARAALEGAGSGIRIDSGPSLWQANADGTQIAQVVRNIVLNADEAMPGGGTVTISTRNVPAGEAESHEGLDRRDYVAITIRDRGVGIPPENLGKIYDPYFSTKEKGRGLGLATAYSIVRNHDGRIEVSSEVGSGTAVTVLLPASPLHDAIPAAVPRREGANRILLMDDEELVRQLAEEQIRFLGYEVESVPHGEGAIDKYREAKEAGRPFALAILDITIRGGLGGLETVRRLREIDPEVVAVGSSGYSDEAVVSAWREHGFRAFLKKPYGIGELQDVLLSLLPDIGRSVDDE